MNACFTVASIPLAASFVASLAAQSQSPSSPRDLAQELAARIAAAVAPLDQVRLVAADPTSADAAEDAGVLRDVAAELRARGLSLVNALDGAASVRVSCSENLRERVCAAEIVKGDNRDVVTVSRSWPSGGATPASPRLVTLDVRPVLARSDAILDLVEVGGRLLVFHTAGFDLYRRGDTGWIPAGSAAFPSPVTWPRDPRGRLKANGDRVDAFLPDMVCRCTLEPLNAECTASTGVSWPVGPPNSGLAPGANYFVSARVPSFFSGASLGTDAGSGWLLAGVDGKLHVLGAGLEMRQLLPGIGDDVAIVQTPCAPRGAVIAASAAGESSTADAVRAYEIAGNRVVPLTSPVQMAGSITAVWETPARTSVLVVAHNREMERYEAFYVGLACVR